jgi:hypothetical protein
MWTSLWTPGFDVQRNLCKSLKLLVGAARFELATPCAQGRCATRLRYAPTFAGSFILGHFPAFPKHATGHFLFFFGLTVSKLYQNPSVRPVPTPAQRQRFAHLCRAVRPPVALICASRNATIGRNLRR